MGYSKQDIYSRIEELVDEMKGDWKTLFESDDYGRFLRSYIGNLIAGVYDSLRVEGSRIPDSLLETEMNRFRLERIYDPNSEVKTACCSSTENVFTITVNGAGVFVTKAQTTEERHEIVLGLIVHEVGHRLFTDFRTAIAQGVQMEKYGKWFPIPPSNIGTAEGIMLQQKLYGNEDYRKTFSKAMQELSNCIEDGYIENEMRRHYPGVASSYLAATNAMQRSESFSLTDFANDPEPSKMAMVLSQWLEYAKYGELNIGERDESEFEPEVIEAIYAGMDLIDEAVELRDPRRRASIINELAVILSPFIDEEIKKADQNNAQNGGSSKANSKVQNQISHCGSAANGGVPQNANGANGQPNTSQSITNPNRSTNSGLQQTVNGNNGSSGNSQGQNGEQDAQKSGGNSRGTASGGEIDHSAAEHDLDDMLTSAAVQKAKEEAERERTKDMQKEAENIEYSLSDEPPHITRAEKVSLANENAYKKYSGRLHQISQRLAQVLLKQLKQYTDDDSLPWQYSGNKFVSKQYCRDNLKGFKRNTMPRPSPNLSVYVLADESGSVTEELSTAEIKTAIILEDFCRTCSIPLCIQGYTSAYSGCEIFSYVEEKKIDDKDKYRITGMSSRGGTPTVCAMEYALGRLKKQPADMRKILFVITDGGAGDDDAEGTNTKKLIARAKREKVIVVACGIGSQKGQVQMEFDDDHFLGIDDLDQMPTKLLEIIRRNMDGVRR